MGGSYWQEHWNTRRVPFQEECRRARAALLADLGDPAATQRRVLTDVVELCRDSLHWKERGYDTVGADDKSFRDTLPVRRYDDFAAEIDRETRTKGGVLSCSPVLRWLKTSGTTGAPKRVPYTLHWLLNYRVPAMQAMWGTYLDLHPALGDHPYATLDTQTVHENVDDFLYGVQYQAISNRHPRINSRDGNPPWSAPPWFGVEAPTSHTGRMYHRIRHFLGRRLEFITAINPSTLVSLRDLIAEHGPDLVRDLAAGTMEGRPYGDPDPEAAAHLQSVLDQGEFTLKDVWPSLGAYSCWLSSSAGLYRSKLDAVLPGVRAMPFMSGHSPPSTSSTPPSAPADASARWSSTPWATTPSPRTPSPGASAATPPSTSTALSRRTPISSPTWSAGREYPGDRDQEAAAERTPGDHHALRGRNRPRAASVASAR
ncbi:hypothetical protein QFZ49_002804 [Streptomyces turgidiscabies]|uniref:GH3 auxin-responsive promoter n=1 Tax=Streptomyces turgidiscabies TaxID=85558 RepID=A0ABU0RLJ9_9ACTN|nr:GH3 auxin-responsive promoter family protein [Streptomyces turgidiscabies]MDQ0932874.1 hypothetical protein [Streptomyces turgidiscabies]